MRRSCETYGVQCWNCSLEIEQPADPPAQPQELRCPKCGARLDVEWRQPCRAREEAAHVAND